MWIFTFRRVRVPDAFGRAERPLQHRPTNIRFDSLRLLYILCHSSLNHLGTLHYDNLSSNMHECVCMCVCVLAEVSALERWIWAAVTADRRLRLTGWLCWFFFYYYFIFIIIIFVFLFYSDGGGVTKFLWILIGPAVGVACHSKPAAVSGSPSVGLSSISIGCACLQLGQVQQAYSG